jgi:hypothetical protein
MAIQFPGGRTIPYFSTDQSADISGKASTYTAPHPSQGSAKEAPCQRASGDARSTAAMCTFRLASLPPELQVIVGHYVAANPNKRESARSVNALMLANKQLRSILQADTNLQNDCKIIKKILSAVDHLPLECLSDRPLSILHLLSKKIISEALDECLDYEDDEDKIEALANWASKLPALDDADQERVIKLVLTGRYHDVIELSNFISRMGAGLHAIDPKYHKSLVARILSMNENSRSRTLNGFGQALPSLHDDLKKALVHAALAIQPGRDNNYKSLAIQGLAKGLEALKPSQCAELAHAALNLVVQEQKSYAIEAFGPHLALFEPAEQKSLITAALSFVDSEDKARAIGGLSRGLGKLNAIRYGDVLTQLRSVAAGLPDPYKVKFISQCGEGLQPSEDPLVEAQRQGLVIDTLSMAREANKSHAIEGLGAGLHALNAGNRGTLVTAALQLTDQANKCAAITGLLKHGLALIEGQRDQLFDAMLELPELEKSRAIANLGSAAGLLTPKQRGLLVGATLALSTEDRKSEAIAGLGKAISALTGDEGDKLVSATLSMRSPANKTKAIEGLARITGIRREHLIDGALTLPLGYRVVALDALVENMA